MGAFSLPSILDQRKTAGRRQADAWGMEVSPLTRQIPTAMSNPISFQSIPVTIFKNGKENPDRPALAVKRAGEWVKTSWAEYANLVRKAALALLELGLQPGDRTCLLADPRPEWVISLSDPTSTV